MNVLYFPAAKITLRCEMELNSSTTQQILPQCTSALALLGRMKSGESLLIWCIFNSCPFSLSSPGMDEEVALSCLCLPRSRGINEFRTISFNSIECRFQAGATLLSVRLFPSPKGTCCNRSCSTGRSGFKIGQIQASNLRSFLTEETKSDPYAAKCFLHYLGNMPRIFEDWSPSMCQNYVEPWAVIYQLKHAWFNFSGVQQVSWEDPWTLFVRFALKT